LSSAYMWWGQYKGFNRPERRNRLDAWGRSDGYGYERISYEIHSFRGVNCPKFEILKNVSGGLGADRAPGGFRAKPWPGVQGAGGPRKLLHFSLFETKKSLLLSLKTPVFLSDSKQKKKLVWLENITIYFFKISCRCMGLRWNVPIRGEGPAP